MLNLAVYSSDGTMLSAYLNFGACIKRIVAKNRLLLLQWLATHD